MRPPEDHSEAGLRARWPHLDRPGPQPPNRIAATLEEQLQRALGPHLPAPYPRDVTDRLVASVALRAEDVADALLTPAVVDAVLALVLERLAQRPNAALAFGRLIRPANRGGAA